LPGLLLNSYQTATKAAELLVEFSMGSLSIEPHLSVAHIKERLYGCKSGRYASYWQIILTLSLSPGKRAQEYAALLGCSEGKLYRIRSLYNKEGPDFTKELQWGGRRESCRLMSVEEEEELLESWTATAVEGGVLVAKQLREAVEQKTGHGVSDDYLWDLLHRHGWSKKAARPQHPKAVEVQEQREAFKKKQPPSFIQETRQQSR
jgi:transposase